MRAIVDKLRAQAPRAIDVIGLGECSLDAVYPLHGRLRDHLGKKGASGAALMLGGGQVATAMCALSRLGWRSEFMGVTGDDAAGAAVLSGLTAEGVRIAEVRVIAGAATRSALLLVDDDGERTVIEHRDARLALPNEYPSAAAIATARVVHVDGTYLEASLRAARLGRDRGAIVSLDLDVPSAAAAELLTLADLCVLPIDFVTAFTGDSDVERGARRIGSQTSGQVIVTLGAAGGVALAADGDLIRQSALRPPGGVIDTTGCGDTFRAALIAAIFERAALPRQTATAAVDADLIFALRFASAAAALKCQGRGRSGCPNRAAVAALLAQGNLGP